jgi:hypothetical protein
MTLEERIQALELAVMELQGKKKATKTKYDRSQPLSDFITQLFTMAKQRGEKRFASLAPCKVTQEEAIEHLQANEKFMSQYALWCDGADGERPTLYFNNGLGIKQLTVGVAKDFAGRFKKS